MNEANPKVAFINGPLLGDSIIDLSLISQIQSTGIDVTLYNNVLKNLNSILPIPIISFNNILEISEQLNHKYDLIIISWNRPVMLEIFKNKNFRAARDKSIIINYSWHVKYLHEHGITVLPPKISHANLTIKKLVSNWNHLEYLPQIDSNLLDGIKDISLNILNSKKYDPKLLYKIGDELSHRKNKKTVVICPSSSSPKKNWALKKFYRLANRLKDLGYNPIFIIPENEKENYSNRLGAHNIFSGSLLDVAYKIYESGYYIGNDSGIGHLASSLDIPTLTIFVKHSTSNIKWWPGFTTGIVVKPKLKLWTSKYHRRSTITVSKVIRQFKKLEQLI